MDFPETFTGYRQRWYLEAFFSFFQNSLPFVRYVRFSGFWKKLCPGVNLKTTKDNRMKLSGMIDLFSLWCMHVIFFVAVTSGRHRKWLNKSSISNFFLSNWNLYRFTRSSSNSQKMLIPPEVESPTSGYIKESLFILSFFSAINLGHKTS